MTHTMTYARLEAVHKAWQKGADGAEPGVTRLTFVRGMKTLAGELQTYQEERVQLSLEAVLRDDEGKAVPQRDDGGAEIPGMLVLRDPPAYHAALQALDAVTVTVSLPPLTEDLLCRTSADAPALAILLDFVPENE